MRSIQKNIVGFLIVLGVVSTLVIVCGMSSGETIIVAQDGNGDYRNIQDAVDAAGEGDMIRVWEGAYEENVVLDKSL